MIPSPAHRRAPTASNTPALPRFILTRLQRQLDDDTMRAAASVLLATSPLLDGAPGRCFEDNQEARVVGGDEECRPGGQVAQAGPGRPSARPGSGRPALGGRRGRTPSLDLTPTDTRSHDGERTDGHEPLT
ncbi:hypothetical protein GCM10017562_02410 [Streptomyces roseofulvus]